MGTGLAHMRPSALSREPSGRVASENSQAQHAGTDLDLRSGAYWGQGLRGNIRADASIDANRGKDWFDQQAQVMIEDATKTDHFDDARAAAEGGNQQSDRVPAELADRTRRRDRIRQAAQELHKQTQRGPVSRKIVRARPPPGVDVRKTELGQSTRPGLLRADDARRTRRRPADARCEQQQRSRHRHRAGGRRIQQRREPQRRGTCRRPPR